MPRSISEAPTRTTTVAAFTTTYTSPSWITIPVAQMTSDPFCHNEADPDEGIGNHCVCSNGETVSVIPWTTGGNISDYQPCAYTTAAYIAKISDTPPCHAVPITTVFAVADGTTIPITTSMVTCVG
ncbi:hypothetical protein B0T17DRAFT_544980 [Bombardia bombarda]|uniref:Uncharacterized protein n=1 Tax=Bombardia bombarda TaxID=252184 RepID=A0AA39TGY1_9PEZI|nr:hypothetical protein B0T17DRAFT_544980 [Bombardia bombarda]